RGRGRLVGRHRLGEEQGAAVLVHHVGVGGGRAERGVLAGAELADQPGLADEHRPELVRVLVHQTAAGGERVVGRDRVRVVLLDRQAVAAGAGGAGRQGGERGG